MSGDVAFRVACGPLILARLYSGRQIGWRRLCCRNLLLPFNRLQSNYRRTDPHATLDESSAM